jgi:ubiquinone/menaquinone biosynthesis C-methylase UbiE
MGFDTREVASLYNIRFDKYGRDIKTVGWGSESSQRLRFEVLLRGLEPKGKTILDIGCGLGNLIPFLEECTGGDFSYIGIDVAEKLIVDARSSYGCDRKHFYVGDIFSLTVPSVDISLLSGALSLKAYGIEQYANHTMERMFEISREAACLNFLSKYVDFELEKNQHYQPEVVFSSAKRLTDKVNLFHDYPLYEFTIQLIKQNSLIVHKNKELP